MTISFLLTSVFRGPCRANRTTVTQKVVYVPITAKYGLGQRAKFSHPSPAGGLGDPVLGGGEERMREKRLLPRRLCSPR